MLRVPGVLAFLAVGLVLYPQATPVRAQDADAEKECRDAFSKGEALRKSTKYREALVQYEKAWELAPRAFGEKSLNTATISNNLAMMYWELGQYAKAEPLHQRCLSIREATLGKDHPEVAHSLNNLGILYFDMGQYSKAEPLHLRSLQIREAKLGKDHLDVAQSLCNLALLSNELGQYTKAESLHQRSLLIRESALGKNSPEVAASLDGLAINYKDMGQYAKAVPLYERSLLIRETTLGNDHPSVADSRSNLANLYKDMGLYARAEPLYQRSLLIRETMLGKDHPRVADSLNSLANLYTDLYQYAKAEPLYQRSLLIRETNAGKDHPSVAIVLNNLTVLYRLMGQHAKAETLGQRSLLISEAALGKDHLDVAYRIYNLSVLYREMGEYAKAETLGQRCLRIRETKLGRDHPLVADILLNLCLVDAAQDGCDRAADKAERLRRLMCLHNHRTLPALSDRDALTFLQETSEKNLHVCLTLGLENRGQTAIAKQSAGWLVNSKGVAQEVLAERAFLVRDSADPQVGPLVRDLNRVRSQLAKLTLSLPKNGQEAARQEQLEQLAKQEQDLASRLGRMVSRPQRADPWVSIDEVRKALPVDGILIDIARFNAVNFKKKGNELNWKGYRYAAWLVPAQGQGDIRLIDLGEADKIDQAVLTVRDGFRAAQGTATQKSIILEKGAAEAEKELRPALATLAKLVLEPLAKDIGDKKQWFLSPDGALWLVPWAALPLKDGGYAIENHQITYLISGRDLVSPAFTGKVQRDPPLIIADPDFDIDPKLAAQLTAELLGKQVMTDSGAIASLDAPPGTRSLSSIGRVARLPGTAAEAVAIKPKVATYAGAAPWVYRGKNGLEGIFKSFRSPKVMVLSTHGYFFDQEAKRSDRAGLADDKRPALDKDGNLMENPLLRCGLLLAGCNERGKATGTQEDGVLTGLEIVGCDLRGTELVVLSACETGLGQVRNGEGVAGLRQAFQLAGAQAVVASLWQVSDRDTAFLMSDFFNGLAKGKSKAEALREAQLARIKDHRDRDGAAHPFFWAAFTLTGK